MGWESTPEIGGGITLAQSGAAVSHTGDTTNTALATIAVPAGAMGANGWLEVRPKYTKTGSNGTVTVSMFFGASGAGLGGTQLWAPGAFAATQLSCDAILQIANRNATNSQLGAPANGNGVGSSIAAPTGTIDTTAATEIVIAAQLGSALDTVTLAAYQVLLHPHA